MTATSAAAPGDADAGNAADALPAHVDVLVVGAGISGIGGAYHLRTQLPGTTFAVVEAYPTFGGTWHVHRYPGVRSDSDLFTFGYRFKPWMSAPIATGEEIQRYLGEVIDENDLGPHIHYRRKVTAARWSSIEHRWSVDVADLDAGMSSTITAGFLWMCQGYYRHGEGYLPDWPGLADFAGTIVHPQGWPDDLDVTGKRVVVIGSGATAATLVPAIAERCEHVTMLQRSPTYYWADDRNKEFLATLRSLDLDPSWVHEIMRRKILQEQAFVTQLSFEAPDLLRDELLKAVRTHLDEDDVAAHFTPRYRPWQQRLCLLPDGDLFAAIRSGKASVVTDEIATFTEHGIVTKGGAQLDADVVVTATGFNLSVLGDIAFTVDGKPVEWPATVTWRGMMFTGVPNLAWVFGYLRASWTLRADLVSDVVVRLLTHLRERGAASATPQLRSADAGMTIGPWIEPDNFNAGYLTRSMHLLPKAGDKAEWRHGQDYESDRAALPAIDLDDGCLVYG